MKHRELIQPAPEEIERRRAMYAQAGNVIQPTMQIDFCVVGLSVWWLNPYSFAI